MDDEKKIFDAELARVVKHLPGWKLDPTKACWYSYLTDGTGKEIHVNMTAKKGRFTISGGWPLDSDRQQHIPRDSMTITIARDRPPEKIAAEIQRRFLPWYTAAYAEQLGYANNHNDSRKRQQELTVELAGLFTSKEAMRQMQSDPNKIFAHGITVEVHGGKEPSVSIELRYVDVKLAKAVIRAYVKAGGETA